MNTDKSSFDLDRFHLPGAWRAAAESIIRMWTEGPDPRDLILPKGYWSDFAVERYARAYCEANPRTELGVIFGVCSVAVCVAAQGGMVAHGPKHGGGYLEIPVIEGFIGVAPSGQRKSTALDVARVPLDKVMEQAVRARTTATMQMAADAKATFEAPLGAPTQPDEQQFSKVYGAGICSDTLVKDPTPEALRNQAVNNGGVVGGMSGEPDLFRNIGAYSKDSGALGIFLGGWDQETIEAARVGQGMMRMKDAAILVAVLLQTDVFAEVTGGIGPNGVSGDSFVTRGMFGRYWVVRSAEVGGFEEIADCYADDNDFVNDGPEGYAVNGVLTDLGIARVNYMTALRNLTDDTNEYRARKAMHRAWEKERIEKGTALQVPEPEEHERYVVGMDKGARLAWRRLQRLQLAVEAALYDAADEDAQLVFGPLAARLTQHAMRAALVQTLGGDMRALTGKAIEDAACRILPWRIAHSTDALLKRTAEIGEAAVADTVTTNTESVDLGPAAWVQGICGKLARESTSAAREAGFTKTDIKRRCLAAMPKSKRRNVGQVVDSALEELVARSAFSGIERTVRGKDAVGNPVYRYLVAPWVSAQAH